MPMITVEFFGIPRKRAGMQTVTIEAATVAELILALRESCPGLRDLVDDDGALSSHYLVSIDDQKFVASPETRLAEGTRVLLLSADAGG